MSVYTTFSTGPRRPGDPDGPAEYHVVILDNGRTAMLGTEYQDDAALHPLRRLHEPLPGLPRGRRPRLRLRSIPGRWARCSTRRSSGWRRRATCPNASTFCGRCESVCPMMIPLPKLMRHWREQGIRARTLAGDAALWHPLLGILRARPRLYRLATRVAMRALGVLGRAARPVRQSAACRRMDRAPRHAGAGGAHVHGPLQSREETGVSGREAVLAKVRRALGVSGDEAARKAKVAERLSEARPNLDPGARQTRSQGARRAVLPDGGDASPPRRSGWHRPTTSRRRSAPFSALTIFRCRCGTAPISCLPACRGSASRISSG